jgi:hypothetical protein
MYLSIEENDNCAADERMFSTSGAKRTVAKIQLENPRSKVAEWCEVSSVCEDGTFGPAHAQMIEDSSDGTAWLIFGGTWGLRFRPSDQSVPWSLSDHHQWGLPFLVLDSSGTSIQFK